MIALLPRRTFQITLSSGEMVTGKFGTWALKRFCDRRKVTFDALEDKLANPDLGDIFDLFLAAVEQYCAETKQPCTYTEIDAGAWIDDLGGLQSSDFLAIVKHFSSAYIVPAVENDNEKKSQPLAGEI